MEVLGGWTALQLVVAAAVEALVETALGASHSFRKVFSPRRSILPTLVFRPR